MHFSDIYDIYLFLSHLLHLVYDNLYLHICCCKWHYLILYCGWIIFHTHTHTHTHIYISHLLYSCICRWTLGCCHVLTTVNSIAANTEVHVFLKIRVFFGYMPWSGTTGLYGNSTFSFLRNSILFSTVTAPVYIHTNSVGGFPFLYILSSICNLKTFWWWAYWLVWDGTSL